MPKRYGQSVDWVICQLHVFMCMYVYEYYKFMLSPNLGNGSKTIGPWQEA